MIEIRNTRIRKHTLKFVKKNKKNNALFGVCKESRF